MQKKAKIFFKNSYAKKKNRKCTFDFKINAKKGQKCKKKCRKYIFNFEIQQTKSKMEKKKHIYLDYFRFYIPCAFICISNLKIHIKKDKNAKKS